MIRGGFFAALAVAIAPQAQAFETMLRSDCRAAIAQLSALIVPLDESAEPVLLAVMDASRATPDGWCQIDSRGRGLEDVGFDTLEWRAEAIGQWTRDAIPPLALQIRATGLDPDDMDNTGPTNRPLVDYDVTLRQDPSAGLVILERAEMTNNAGDLLAVSGVFERVFLSSPSMMQVSIGSATFKAGLLSMTLDGVHENPFASSFSFDARGPASARSAGTFNLVESLPEGVIDPSSRAELMAYVEDLPNPIGTLELSLASERGLGLMQIGMSMFAFATALEDGAPSREMDILFDGMTITADWSPAAQMAD